MTEKRFYIAESNLIDGYCVFDREKKYVFSPKPRKADCLNDAHILNKLSDKNEQLKSENKRLTDKLNKTALELVDECISQGKATEISEMNYKEFLDYRAENGKPMELQL